MYLRYTLLKMNFFDILDQKIGIGINISFIHHSAEILYSIARTEEQFNTFVNELKNKKKITFKNLTHHGEVAQIIYCEPNEETISYSQSSSEKLELSSIKHFDDLGTIASNSSSLNIVAFDIDENMWQTISFVGSTLQPSGWIKQPELQQKPA